MRFMSANCQNINRNSLSSSFALESPESSSPIVTRSVAAGLSGRFCNTYTFAPWQQAALRVLGYLPQNLARFAISRFEILSGLDSSRIKGLSSNDLANQRIEDYACVEGSFPAVTIGAALGGASAHIALALGGPFLPQAFVVTLKGGSYDGNVLTYFRRSAALARNIAAANPDLLTIQHYDPVHDEWMTRFVNHLRFKLLDLPPAYLEFIKCKLRPGGAVCFLDCEAQWLRYRVGERNYFQVGGWGGISPQEFMEGSERLQRFCRSVGLRYCQWSLPDYPLERGPESEWGCEPGLGEALQDFCRREGYRFIRISLSQPHDYSLLAYRAIAHLLQAEDRPPAGVLVEMFSQFDASAVMQTGLLPLWLVFNTLDSLDFLKEMRAEFPDRKPVFFSPLATFSHTPDIVPWEAWEKALDGLDWRNIGTRPEHYPADPLALTCWAAPLREWVASHYQPLHSRLEAEQLQELAVALEKTAPGID